MVGKNTALVEAQVLVVDDNQKNRVYLAQGVQRLGCSVLEAENGREALEILGAQAVDLVLLDLMLPEVNGFQVLQEIKADPVLREIPVIVISGIGEMEMVAGCIEMGAEDYLSKPFDPVLLKARITSSLEKKQRHDRELADLKHLDRLTEAAAAVESGVFAPELLAEVAARPDAIGKLAQVFQNMAQQVAQREQTLQQQLQQLRIDLDRARQSGQVKEITESDYFQELQAKTRDLKRMIGSSKNEGKTSRYHG